jgi:hypothetical protein
MKKFEFLLYDPRKFFAVALSIFFVLPLLIAGLVGRSANAMNGNPPAPYTGGAPVAKVIYPADGSTITVTSTGAVIKQSPGGTPYRQGWVNPSQINNYNTVADMRGHIAYGSSNPYTASNNGPYTQPMPTNNCGNNCCNNNCDNNCDNQCQNDCNNTCHNDCDNRCHKDGHKNRKMKYNYQNSTSNTYVTNNYPTRTVQKTYARPQTRVVYQNQLASAQSPAYKSTSSTQPKYLPNTGPSDVMAIGGLTTALATIGHFVYHRRRLA